MNTKKTASAAGQKEPVTLREKVLTNGNKSLYLDIYWNGKRKYEFLRLYLINATTPEQKEQNRQTLATAQAVRAKRQVEFQNGEYGFKSQFKSNAPFLDYFRKMVTDKKKNSSCGNWGDWKGCLNNLEKYCTEQTSFKDITPEWVEGFKRYLNDMARVRGGDAPLSQNTKALYYSKFKTCILDAYNDNIITENPLRGVGGIKGEEVERVCLSAEEVQAMAKTSCSSQILKRVYLFSCLTGLRKSDIVELKWGDVSRLDNYTRIVFRQKKTKGQEYLDINPQAVELMGERGQDNDRVFDGFKYTAYTNKILKIWAKDAGINKPLTFHSGRHTFATMVYAKGASLYTVQKLLGHRDIKTTEIYAKIVDKTKQEAIDLIPNILGKEEL